MRSPFFKQGDRIAAPRNAVRQLRPGRIGVRRYDEGLDPIPNARRYPGIAPVGGTCFTTWKP